MKRIVGILSATAMISACASGANPMMRSDGNVSKPDSTRKRGKR